MKVLVSEFLQETNSFCPVITKREDFSNWRSPAGQDKTEVSGIANELRTAGCEVLFGPTWRAQASGPVMQSVVDSYLSELTQSIRQAGSLDGVCLALHGATQSTQSDDVCGDVAAAVRRLLGAEKALAVSVDLHANVTAQLYENADFVCGYQTYPHRDMYKAGARAAALCVKRMQGASLCTARVEIPMIVPASGYTTEDGAFGALVEKAHKLVDEGRLVDYTICQMQPWLDVKAGGTTVLTVSEDADEAKRCAVSLGQELSSLRDDMWPPLKTVDEIIDIVESGTLGKPAIVSDFADSPNAGAAGDDVTMLERLIARGATVRAAVIVNDPAAAKRAFEVGVGNSARFSLGGTLDAGYGRHVDVEARVQSLHDGDYVLGGPAMRGTKVSNGLTAVLSVGCIDILVCTAMKLTGDIRLYRQFGIEPEFYQLVLVKANTSFRAVYSKVSDAIFVCDTNRAATANLKGLPFIHLPQSYYPFRDIGDFKAAEHITVRRIAGI